MKEILTLCLMIFILSSIRTQVKEINQHDQDSKDRIRISAE
jgi:hypothetical protein